MHCVVCHNANSGWGNHSKSSIKAAMKLAGFDTTFCAPDDRALMNVAFGEHTDLVVVAGGDGTVAKVALSLLDRRIPIAILPLGTANNIARSLGVFGNPVDLAESWDLDHWRPLNIGVAAGPWGRTPFVESFGIGPFAKLIKKGENLKSLGAEQLRDGRKLLAKIVSKAKPIAVTAGDDGPWDNEILAAEITSIAYVGPGLKLAKSAEPGDGFLDVVTLANSQRDAFIRWLADACEGPAPLVVRRRQRVDLSWSKSPYRIDDRYFDAAPIQMTATIELESQPVKILVRPAAMPMSANVVSAVDES